MMSERLTNLVLDAHAERSLTSAYVSGELTTLIPEIAALDLRDRRHKDMLAHSIRVAAKTPRKLELRLTGLLHDIGKPKTRRFEDGKVTFQFHEAVGAKIAADRLARLGYDEDVVSRVRTMVHMSGEIKQAQEWSDAAVRRFVSNAGDTLDDLMTFFRCDTTSKHADRRRAISHKVDALRDRIEEVRVLDASRAVRPVISGDAVMHHFGLDPGPLVGQVLQAVLAAQRVDPGLTTERALSIARDVIS